MNHARFSHLFIAICTLTTGLFVLGPKPFAAADVQMDLAKASHFYSQKNYPKAEKFYRKVLKEAPNQQAAILGIAMCLTNRDKLEPALKLTEQLIQDFPGYAPAYFTLGNIYEKQGNLPQAKAAYREFVEHSHHELPDDPEVHLKLRRLNVL
jgi:tetratricopeptide (TPR) repeat protein